MWLQAQISDLEYRIRQHNEIHRYAKYILLFVLAVCSSLFYQIIHVWYASVQRPKIYQSM